MTWFRIHIRYNNNNNHCYIASLITAVTASEQLVDTVATLLYDTTIHCKMYSLNLAMPVIYNIRYIEQCASALHFTAQYYTAIQYTVFQRIVLCHTTLYTYCTAPHCNAPYYSLDYIASYCILLQCTRLQSTTLRAIQGQYCSRGLVRHVISEFTTISLCNGYKSQ